MPTAHFHVDVQVTASFEAQLADFPFVSRSAQQKELVDVLKTVQEHYDFKCFVEELAGNGKVTVAQLAQIASTAEISNFAQKLKDRKERCGVDGFVPDYYAQRGSGYGDGAVAGASTATSDTDCDGDTDAISMESEQWSEVEEDDDDSLSSTERERERADRGNDSDIGHHYDNQHEERYNQIETSSSFKPKNTMSRSEEMKDAQSQTDCGRKEKRTQNANDRLIEEEQKPIMDEPARSGIKILEDHTTEDSVSGIAHREEQRSAAAGKCICIVL